VTYFLDLSIILWIVGLIAVAIIVYGFVEAASDEKTEWKKLEEVFGTKKVSVDYFNDARRMANGLLKVNNAAIGANVRIVGDGILVRGIGSSIILLPWSKVRKANSQTADPENMNLLVRRPKGEDIEITLPWLNDFPSLEQ